VEKYITDTAFEMGWVQPAKPRRELAQSVGIIGGGPSGLAAADLLRRMGYQVTVYDRHDRIGGLMIYGIPNFKLEKDVVLRRVDLLAQAGVVFKTDFAIGRDAMLADLRAKHDALLIATGVYKARKLQAPGVGLRNIVPALDFLTASNRKGLGDSVPAFESGALNAEGKNVAVIGGGDTAMDCVRTAVRQGAKSVKCLYRRDRANMPGSQREVKHAEEEGVEFVWLSAPEAFLGDQRVRAVRASRIHLGVPDATGRQQPQTIEGSHFNIDADLVIKALGFDPDDLPVLFKAPELKVTRWGTLAVDHRGLMTNLPGVFAAGDIVRGASLVVWAVRDGRDAAEGMQRYLRAKATGAEPVAQAAD
jgi:glutamate synthase (NADPH/NADH) small chain